MRVVEGDSIGLKDGRFGTVAFLVTQRNFLVTLAPDINEPMPEEPEQVWTGIENVASIV